MSSKKSNDDLKKRLQASKDQYDTRSFTNSFKMEHISGETNIRKIDIKNIVEAPVEWNFYKPLSEEKMSELIESIENNGLLHPIVVWEQEDGKYMVLAGHNRIRAYRYLEQVSEDSRYSKISAHIKRKDEISEEEAKEIIIDTNWVQRTLSPIEKSKSIIEKYAVLEKRKKFGTGRTRDIIAGEYEISGRLIEEYRRLGNLIPELKDMVSESSLSVTSASKIALFDEDIQRWILENYENKLSRKYTKSLKTGMDRESISEVFKDKIETVELSITVSKEMANRYRMLMDEQKVEIAKAVESMLKEC